MIQVYTDGQEVGSGLTHEYDLLDIGGIVALKSAGSSWYKPGEVVLKVKDTGNEYIFKLEKFKLRLTYAEAEQMLILLGYLSDEKIEIRKSEVIKSL